MASHKYSFELKSDLSELETLCQHLNEFGQATGLSEACITDVNIWEVLPDGLRQSNYAHTDDVQFKGETILETIYHHDAQNFLKFVVQVEYGLSAHNHVSDDDWRAVIYKPARDVNIAELIEQAKSQAAEQVAAESEF